ncbi:MAG: potassium/proton antiporter [Prolixibacteraceae bacterium]|jgi:cell volume regulation protein A|nr:potassium/proton antiporter [Prolixibacteraceae bacterium]
MSFSIENVLLIGSILLIMSVFFTKTSSRFGVPALLLFLAIGMFVGSEGPGGIHFDNPGMARFIGAFSLCFILFSGGLDTKRSDIGGIILPGILLSSVGVLVTCVLVGLFVHLVTEFTFLEGLLLGAIVSSTDAAAVFSILRSKGLGVKGKLRPLLELESGSNDPMAYFLTIVFLFLITNPDQSMVSLIPLFLKQMVFGGLVGIGMGKLMQWLINKIKLDVDGLYSVLLMGLMLFTFSATDYIGGNGFLAVYLSAFTLGNTDFIHKRSLTKHFDGWAWLMQIVLFLTLGLQVFPSQVVPYIGIGLLISVFLIVIARPVTIFLVLLPFRFNFRSKVFLSWVGLRGAVPIVFATYPLALGLPNSGIIFNVVFFISITSVLIQGTTIPFAARLLRLSIPAEARKKTVLDRELADKVRSLLGEITIDPGFVCAGKSIVSMKLPQNVLIVMIKRENRFLIPDGATIVQPGDKLVVMADDKESIGIFRSCLRG